MVDITDASTGMTKRLRRWVVSEDESLPLHLDEQEQEQVIATLRAQNARSNDLFKVCPQSFTVLSLLPTVIFIIIPSHMSLLAITSLALTAYTAYFLPPKQGMLPTNPDHGPLRYIPVLNGILACVVILDGFVRESSSETLWMAIIPVFMWVAIWIGRGWTNNIDVDGLEKLKYNASHIQKSYLTKLIV